MEEELFKYKFNYGWVVRLGVGVPKAVLYCVQPCADNSCSDTRVSQKLGLC